MHIQEVDTIDFIFDHMKVERRVQIIRIVHSAGEGLLHMGNPILLDSNNSPAVIDTKENMTTIAIGEGTDRAIHLCRDIGLCSFELNVHAFTLGNHIQQLVRNPHMPSLSFTCHQQSLDTIKPTAGSVLSSMYIPHRSLHLIVPRTVTSV